MKPTRRQFISQGLLQATAVMFAPTILGSLLREQNAYAAGCAAPGAAPGMLPFLLFDCAGGAALPGNWLVGKKGGSTDFLASYDRMGVAANPAATGNIDARFGVPMYSDVSQVFAGITQTASAGAQANLRMGTVCTVSLDDSAANLLSPVILISKAGMRGTSISSALGTKSSLSGGNSAGAVSDAALRPLTVGSVDDVLGALSYGPALQGLAIGQRSALAQAILRLSRGQSQKLAAMTLGDQLTTLAECGFVKNTELVTPPANLDPRQDANCQAIYGITTGTTGGATQSPAVVFNVLNGNSGPGVITIGGCDYHDGTQTTGDAKDLQIGQEIGRAVELAFRMGRPLFFGVITDGGIYSDPGTRAWRGDAGTHGLGVIGYFNPAGAPSMRRTQLGQYNDGQGVDRTTYVGSDPKRLAYVLYANYLSACGRVGSFAEGVSTGDFDATKIDDHLLFG